MSQRKNRNFGSAIASAVRAELNSDPGEVDPAEWNKTWISSWRVPVRARDRARRWLSWGLEGALQDIPSDHMIRYLTEMADDIKQLGIDEARIRFLDKILPGMLSNEALSRTE